MEEYQKKYPSLATFSMYCLYTDEAYALLIMKKICSISLEIDEWKREFLSVVKLSQY